MAKVDIIIADDHELIREAVSFKLAKQRGWRVVGEAENGMEAVKLCRKLQPDIAILDISMPELNGIGATSKIRKYSPRTRVLILTMLDSDKVIEEALSAGAYGYILKSDTTSKLIEAIESLLEGKPYFSGASQSVLLKNVVNRDQDIGTQFAQTRSLSGREAEILQLIAEGNRNKEIAHKLSLSVHTVDAHRTNIMNKLNLRTVADLVRYAIRNNIIES